MVRTDNEFLELFINHIHMQNDPNVEQIEYGKGDLIIAQGTLGKNVYLIKEGIVKCHVSEANGKEFVQEFFGSGKLLGELEVLTDSLSFSNVTALSTVIAYKLNKACFLKLLEKEIQLTVKY